MIAWVGVFIGSLGLIYGGFILGWWYYGGIIAELRAALEGAQWRIPKHGEHGRFVKRD